MGAAGISHITHTCDRAAYKTRRLPHCLCPRYCILHFSFFFVVIVLFRASLARAPRAGETAFLTAGLSMHTPQSKQSQIRCQTKTKRAL